MHISFKVSERDAGLIDTVLDRVEALAQADGMPFNRFQREMDLTACQANGLELDLEAMATWDRDFDLVHDVYGIMSCLNRETMQFNNLFSPRFTKRKEA